MQCRCLGSGPDLADLKSAARRAVAGGLIIFFKILAATTNVCVSLLPWGMAMPHGNILPRGNLLPWGKTLPQGIGSLGRAPEERLEQLGCYDRLVIYIGTPSLQLQMPVKVVCSAFLE